MRSDCKPFLAFCEANPDKWEDLLQRVCEAHYANDENAEGISFDVRHMHDAVNYTINGSVEFEGKQYRFTIDDGNWNGTVVREWGDEETVGLYEPPPPTQYDMIPLDPHLKVKRPHMWKVYLLWRKEEWFKELIRSYTYDSHFAPGGKTETYWRDRAKAKGLRIVTKEHAEEEIAA
jgi:hypothetical protein